MSIPALASELGRVHEALARFWRAADALATPPPVGDWRLRFDTAVVEIGTNIVRHAHLNGTLAGEVALCLRLEPGGAEATFRDRGIEYVERPRGESTAREGLEDLPEGGLGLALARAALDEMEYTRTPEGENRWRLVKRLGGR